jgi:L-fuculose-phosphate aldolase
VAAGGTRSSSMTIDDIRFKIAAARRMMYREGCDSGVAGHVSARAESGDSFWVTPFEYFDETTPDRLLLVDFDLNVIEGGWAPSPAIQFHAAIYRARPDVNSIIHTHSYWVSTFSALGRPLGMYNVASVLFHGRQVCFEDDGTAPSADGARLAAALGTDNRFIMMKNHGALIVADSVENATVEAITMEKVAKYHLDVELTGGTEMAPAEVEQSQRDYDQYFRPMVWDANLRRIRRTDPDLFTHLSVESSPHATPVEPNGIAASTTSDINDTNESELIHAHAR